MSTPRPRREYSAEFRADAVRMVTELGKPRSQVARELELNVSTLGRWVATEIGTLGTGRGSARRAPSPEDNLRGQLPPDIPGGGGRLPEAVFRVRTVRIL